MKLDVRKVGKICVFDISGSVTVGPDTALMREKSRELLGEGERLFVFNMLDVPWIDSSGVGEVVACRNRIKANKGTIKVVLKDRAHDIFVMSELGKLMGIHKDLENALGDFVD
jgi:anti-sigma B factor antagonist